MKIKARVYQSCVQSAMLQGSETWYLREELGILRRTERAMCGAKLAERKITEDMMDMLGLNQTIDKMTKASGVRWLGYVLRKDCDVVTNALEIIVEERRKRERPKRTWRKQEERSKGGLNLKDTHNRIKARERKQFP